MSDTTHVTGEKYSNLKVILNRTTTKRRITTQKSELWKKRKMESGK